MHSGKRPRREGEIMSSELLDQYISLKSQMAALQRQIDKLKPQVATYVLDRGGSLAYKDFELRTRVSKVWKFSDEVALLERIVKDKKKQEIETGKAKLEKETPFVILRSRRHRNRRDAARTGVKESRKAYAVSQTRRAHRRAYMPWSRDEDNFVVRQLRDGYSVDEISANLDRQTGAIRSRLKKLGQT
jgi:hypothetical protein